MTGRQEDRLRDRGTGPVSGKVAQCKKIVAKYGLSHLSSGEVKVNTPRGAQLTALMAAGQLVCNDVVLELIKETMLKELAKGSKGFLLDGSARLTRVRPSRRKLRREAGPLLRGQGRDSDEEAAGTGQDERTRR